VLRTHCEQGGVLESTYLKTTLKWVNAETRKRMAVAVAAGISNELWHEIARRADDARSTHDEALSDYIDHVVACPECHPADPTAASPAPFPYAPDPSELPEIASVARHRGSH
jgi:hypothetical protein